MVAPSSGTFKLQFLYLKDTQTCPNFFKVFQTHHEMLDADHLLNVNVLQFSIILSLHQLYDL